MTPQTSDPSTTSSPSTVPRTIWGAQPGLLDPSQSSRLLRFPGSKLIFASFNPNTALVNDRELDIRRLNITDSLPPPKRIVIETSPKGSTFWRFVPRAHLAEGVQSEGLWPRLIDICGEHVYCSQDQWEIYKLDPAYRCTVYPGGKLSSITRVSTEDQNVSMCEPSGTKRMRMTSPEFSEPTLQKRARSYRSQSGTVDDTNQTDTDSEEDEVEDMIIDERISTSTPKPSSTRKPGQSSRETMHLERRRRWQKNKKRQEKYLQDVPISAESSFSMRVDNEENSGAARNMSPIAERVKRKGSISTASDDDAEESEIRCGQEGARSNKRVRTSSNNKEIQLRERKRLQKITKFRQRRGGPISTGQLGFNFIPEVNERDSEHTTTGTGPQQPNDAEECPDSEAIRQAEIMESIRKMRELEQDRPLWDEQRRKREARETTEEEERRVKAEQRRYREEQRKMREQEEAERERARAQAQAEAERRAREEEARHRENHKRRQRERWESGPWTPARALERYKALSEEFDTQTFSANISITFHDIPWPVLHAPSRLTVEDVDWAAVEAFFGAVKARMRSQDFKEFVEKSHRRFHPDRWRARKVWIAVRDEVERSFMEVAANTVAQALTPIWRGVKGV
ncbi:hypothetical protein V8B97DRAFT_1891462 [Scleroderma yunnanense]